MHVKWLNEPLKEIKGYNDLIENIKKNITPVAATGVIDVQKSQIISAISKEFGRKGLIIAADETEAKAIFNDLTLFGEKAVYFPSQDFIFYSADVHSSDITKLRYQTIDMCLKNEVDFVCTTAEALLNRLMPKNKFIENIFEIKEGDIFVLDKLIQRLVYLGYERSDIVEGVGQFSVRGGIVDVFSPVEDTAVRIEFWDDEVDSLRLFDVVSQRSL